ncbi:MAG TPA: hypothetical protein VGB49_05245 [Caulobacteraceae bacterium]
MTEEPDKPSAADALKRALAAKKAAGSGHANLTGSGGKGSDKVLNAKNVVSSTPAFRKASKRG